MKKIAILIAAITTLTSCGDELAGTLEKTSAVVQGYLFAGRPVDSIRITRSFSYALQDSILDPLDELLVTISDGVSNVVLQPIGDGYYQAQDLVIQEGKQYTLEFLYDGEKVSASTYVPLKREVEISSMEVAIEPITGPPAGGFTQLDPVEVSWQNQEGDHYYVLFRNTAQSPENIIQLSNFPFAGNVRFARLTQPEITDFYAIAPRRDLTQYGLHQVIVFRVNPEYAALYQLTGTSSVSITEPPSNVTNGLGIFTAVSSDTVFLNVKKP